MVVSSSVHQPKDSDEFDETLNDMLAAHAHLSIFESALR
jgi:hypothetical protein